MTDITINTRYGTYYIRQVRGEEEYQIYEERSGVGSFTGIYADSVKEAFTEVYKLLDKRMEEARVTNSNRTK